MQRSVESARLAAVWLDKDMRWHGGASGKRGRSSKYGEAAIQFCVTIKSLFNLPLRQAMGMTQSLLCNKASVSHHTSAALAITFPITPTNMRSCQHRQKPRRMQATRV